MPKNIVSYRFPVGAAVGTPYLTDDGQSLDVTGRFVLPPDIDDLSKNIILSSIDAVELTEGSVCSDSGLGRIRKLTFVRASGNTMSVGVNNPANILAVATAVSSVLNVNNNQVVCIKLDGEVFRNLNDRMQLNYTGTTALSHKAPATALKQNYVTGSINYTSTVTGAGLRAIKSITESADNIIAGQIIAGFIACAGTVQNITACGNGRRNPLKHRRFILELVTKLDPADTAETVQTESIEVPVSSDSATDILNCGRALAALPGVFCVGYQGESYSRIHRLI